MRWIGIVLLLTGCSGVDLQVSYTSFDNEHPHYHVLADAGFTPSQRANIVAALNEWEDRTNGVMLYNIDFVDASKLKKTEFTSNTIYMWSNVVMDDPGLFAWTAWDNGANGAYILVAPHMDPGMILTATILHEVGHAMHLPHYSLNNLSIMHSGIGQDSVHLECTDLIAFCGVWNCKTDCTIIPERAPTSAHAATCGGK